MDNEVNRVKIMFKTHGEAKSGIKKEEKKES